MRKRKLSLAHQFIIFIQTVSSQHEVHGIRSDNHKQENLLSNKGKVKEIKLLGLHIQQ